MNSVICYTPLIDLKISQQHNQLCEIDFIHKTELDADHQQPSIVDPQGIEDPLLQQALQQILAYLQAPQFVFDLPLNPRGTSFQQSVWRYLRSIPAGEVRTYGEVAAALNSSPRAVGNACRRNPLPLVIPCHRVVSAAGIGGFSGHTAGTQIDTKRQLLAHEGVEI
ncbi:MAG TPA: methylated-DNA--[protein]-cysteine S-methyltransferase [Gammaproteobacteria bacterium]